VGETHAAGAALSSEQVVLLTVPVVVHANVALVAVVVAVGVCVSVTVGAAGGADPLVV
jgi:hypothetical protein